MQKIAHNMHRTAYNMQKIAHNMHRTAYNMQKKAHNIHLLYVRSAISLVIVPHSFCYVDFDWTSRYAFSIIK